MVALRLRVFVAAVLVLACGGRALAGKYTDPSGFAFTYPEGWVPITRAGMELGKDLPVELRDWVAKNNVDLSRIAVALIRNGRDEFLENMNVVVNQQEIPVSDKSVKELANVMTKQFASMKLKAENLQSRKEKVAGRDVIVLEFQSTMPGIPMPLKQKQVMIPGGGKTYIVTCTATPENYAQYAGIFEGILNSFEAPAATVKGFDWSRSMSSGVIGGIIGGLAAAVFGIIKAVSGKKKSERREEF